MTTLKDIENELNSKKAEFVQKIVRDTVTHTTMIAEKTKDTNYAGQIAKAAQDLVAQDMNIPDLHIKDGTTPIAEPTVTIRGVYGDDPNKAYPGIIAKTTYVSFPETEKEIHLIFETNNIKLEGGGYRYLILAKEEKGKFFKRLVVSDNNKFGKRTPNILQNERLPPARYDVFVWILKNNSNESVLNSKGEKVVDFARIEIKPTKVAGTTPSTSHIHLVKPVDGDSILSAGQIDLEFETDLSTPFSYTINFPKAGGTVHEGDSNSKKVKTSFKPQSLHDGYNEPAVLKKGVNKKLEVHIYYPAKSNTVVATKTINVDIV